MSPNPFNRFIESIRRSDTPFTMFLLLATVSAFLLTLSASGASLLVGSLAFMGPAHLAQPWRLFTYPILNFDILSLLFNGLMLWWIGGSLERSWSTRGYAAFWLAASAISAISLSLGALLFHVPMMWVSSYFPLAAVILAWALINPELTIMIWGLVPLKAKYLGLAEVLILFFTHTRPSILMGFFALGGCAFAFWWTRFFVGTSPFASLGGSALGGYPAPPRQDTFFGGAGKPSGGSSPRGANGPKKPKKILTPLDDKRSWKDWGPLAAYMRYRRRKQFERLLDDE